MPDLARIQSLIVQAAAGPVYRLAFFKIESTAGARRFLRACRPRIPSAAEPQRPPPILQLALSWRGLGRLAAGHPGLAPAEGERQLEASFVAPLPFDPDSLGFTGASAPEHWWAGGWRNADLDLALYGAFADDAQADATMAELAARAAAEGLIELRLPRGAGGRLGGHRPAGGIVHFGYRDGISTPAIDWAGDGSAAVDFREILLGYPNLTYRMAPMQAGPWQDLVRDGSIACIAWIEQHVHAFNRFLRTAAGQLAGLAPAGREEEWLAARMMGRWRDGSPIMRWPDTPPATPDLDDRFGYDADPAGRRCPLNAHIRIAHARDDALAYPIARKFPNGPPRFIRRGFTYGPPATGETEDGIERGLVGLFFCARLNEQFFSVLRWMQATTFNDAFDHAPHTSRMQDAVTGTRSGRKVDRRLHLAEGERTSALELQDFITYRGVAHLLMPSLPSLDLLAEEPG